MWMTLATTLKVCIPFRPLTSFGVTSGLPRHSWSQRHTGKCSENRTAVAHSLTSSTARVTRRVHTASSATQPTQHLQDDLRYMADALQQAQVAAEQHEVPVGAVMVCSGQVIARAYNQVQQTGNPTAHAEMLCIQQAARILGGWRLLESTLYVTLEPCPMCAGALLQSRVGTVVYGARNILLGADGSWISLLPTQVPVQEDVMRASRPHPFHDKMQVRNGVMAEECGKLMQAFFHARRQASNVAAKSL